MTYITYCRCIITLDNSFSFFGVSYTFFIFFFFAIASMSCNKVTSNQYQIVLLHWTNKAQLFLYEYINLNRPAGASWYHMKLDDLRNPLMFIHVIRCKLILIFFFKNNVESCSLTMSICLINMSMWSKTV